MYKLGCFDDEKGQFENIKNKIRRNNKELELCWIQGSSSIQDIVKEVCQKKVDVLLIDYEMAKVFGFNGSRLASRMNDYISDLSCFLLTQVEITTNSTSVPTISDTTIAIKAILVRPLFSRLYRAITQHRTGFHVPHAGFSWCSPEGVTPHIPSIAVSVTLHLLIISI